MGPRASAGLSPRFAYTRDDSAMVERKREGQRRVDWARSPLSEDLHFKIVNSVMDCYFIKLL